MAKLSPLQRVREEHGSKAELAGKVIGILDRPEGEPEEEFDHRVHTMSNAKLLRLWNAHERVDSEYGGKSSLAEKIVAARFPGGNDDYQNKLMSFTLPKLLDVARQNGV